MAAQVGKIHQVYFEELRPGNRVAGRSADGRLVSVSGSEELLGKILPVRITKRVNPGMVFIPFHYKEAAANLLTNDALDPKCKIAEAKVCAVKIEKRTKAPV